MDKILFYQNEVSSPIFIDQTSSYYNNSSSSSSSSSSSCRVSGGCVSSNHYPNEAYENNQFCYITSDQNVDDAILIFHYFLTEENHDILSISSSSYSNSNDDDDVQNNQYKNKHGDYSGMIESGTQINIESNSTLTWSSNQIKTTKGFEICYESAASGGALFVKEGNVFISNSFFIKNKATRHGGALSINGGQIKFNSNQLLYNKVLLYNAPSDIYYVGGSFNAIDLKVIHSVAADDDDDDEDNDRFTITSSIGGTSSQSAMCTSSCLIGQYGVCSSNVLSNVTFLEHCHVNCECFAQLVKLQ